MKRGCALKEKSKGKKKNELAKGKIKEMNPNKKPRRVC